MREAGYSVKTAYTKFNMGMGFAVIVKDDDQADAVCRIAKEEGHEAEKVGYVDERKQETPLTVLHNSLGTDGQSGKMVLAEFEGYS